MPDLTLSSGSALPAGAPQDDLISLFLRRYDRPNTRAAYRRDLEDFFGSPAVHLDDAVSVTFVEVNAYLARLESEGRKPSTLRRRIASIRGFFDWLIALGVMTANPAHRQVLRRVRRSKERDRAIIALTAGQAEAIVGAAGDAERFGEAAVRNRVLVLTMLHCVIRRAEAAGMDAEHIRPVGRYWVLDLPDTKGGADQYVKIPAHVVDEIERHKTHYSIDAGPLWRSLSSNNRDGRLSTKAIYNVVCDAAAHAGLGDSVTAHTLRHTGCTLAIEAGASIQQVQVHARHKNIETTMNYIHQRDKLRDSAADFIHLKK